MHKHARQIPWMRTLLFIGILLALLQVLNWTPRQTAHLKNGNFWPYFYREVETDALDIVYMGNSHSKTTIIPEIIDRLLGTRSVHVNTSGESIYQTQYEFREVLRHQNPRLVVLEANPIYAGLGADELKPWNFSFFYAMPFGWQKLAYSLDFFNENDLLKFYLPFTSYHADWKNPDQAITRVKEAIEQLKARWEAEWHETLPYQGYENYLKSLPLDAERKPQTILDNACPVPDMAARLAVTEELLQTAQRAEQAMVVMETAQFVQQFPQCRDAAAELAGRYGVEYIQLMEDEALPPLWFGDEVHMTQFGAVIASVEVAQRIAELLEIPINRELLEVYQSYFFSGYTLEQNGGNVTVTLIPQDADAIREMQFQWDVSRNNEIFLEVEEAGMHSLRFTLPESGGNYFIHIVMYNPAIHYYLRGGITLDLE